MADKMKNKIDEKTNFMSLKIAGSLRDAADLCSEHRKVFIKGTEGEQVFGEVVIELHDLARRIETYVKDSQTSRK